MKKKQIISITTSLFIALVFSIGLSYVSAAWTNPTALLDNGSIAAPVHKGSGSQSKLGDLSVGQFTTLANAGFAQDVFFRGSVNGIANLGTTTPTLKIGGTNKLGTSYVVEAIVNGDVKSSQTVGSSELVNSTLKTLCGDDKGHVVFCTGTVNPPLQVITGTITKFGQHQVRITLAQATPQDMTSPTITSRFDVGSIEKFPQIITILSGGTIGTATATSPIGLPVYDCTEAAQAPNKIQFQIGNVFYDLTIAEPC